MQAHLGGGHVLKWDVAISQFTRCDPHTVDVRLGIIPLQVLSQKQMAQIMLHS